MAGKRFALSVLVLVAFLATSSAASSSEPLRFGINSTLSIRETFECYNALLKYLQLKLENRVEMVLREQPWEIDDLMRQGSLSVALVTPRSYVQNRASSGLELLVVPVINGKPFYHGYILHRKNSTTKDLFGLQGMRYASGKHNSAAGELTPLNKIGEGINAKPEKYFGTIRYVGGINEVLSLVASSQVDAASIDSIAYEYAVRKKMAYVSETKILSKTGPLPAPPIVAKKKMDPIMKAKIREILLNMHSNPDGRAILSGLGFDKFTLPKPSLYNGVK